ncbi:hypothetical protein FS837_003406 [Tulasnella sp. UAMH 9824]|nr:hypothetical protein FS837_003406 [Tulasnella sp. UAMH 9824]
MDPTPDRYSWPRVGLRHIPDDVIFYILDFLQSTSLRAMTLANRHLQRLATPALYRNITLPKKEDKQFEHQESAARLLRTLLRHPSLTVLVRSLENAPPIIPRQLLSRISSEHTDPSDSQAVSPETISSRDPPLGSNPADVMKSCVNLRSLTVAGEVPFLSTLETGNWLSFLLDPSINLKDLKLLVYPKGGIAMAAWNQFVAQILEVQLSLEYLDYSFDNKNPVFAGEQIERWASKLRILGGSQVGGFEALLSNKRSIETMVVRSIPMMDIPHLLGSQLKSANTIRELVYHGPEKDSIDFGELFATMPCLSSFRGETWLSVPLEDFFLKDLPWAFTSAPHLEEFDLRVNYRPPMYSPPILQPKAVETDMKSRGEEWPRNQAALLKRYSTVCPDLRVFTFPDGRRWARMQDTWMFQDCFNKDEVGLC